MDYTIKVNYSMTTARFSSFGGVSGANGDCFALHVSSGTKNSRKARYAIEDNNGSWPLGV